MVCSDDMRAFLQLKRNEEIQEKRKVCSHSRPSDGEESSVLLVRYSLRFSKHGFNVCGTLRSA